MANVLTATVETAFAHVLLRTEFTATGSLTAVVERSVDGGVTWTVIPGSPVTLVGPAPGAGNRIGYLYDTGAPLNTPTQYRSTNNLGTVTTAGPVTVTSAAGVSWLKDPARPWADVRIDLCTTTVPEAVSLACATPPVAEPSAVLVAAGLGTEVYAGDFTLFPVLNRARPADVYAYRKDAVTSWSILSRTLATMNTLKTFYAWGGPILIQLPPEYGWPDRYYQPGDVSVSRITERLDVPLRLWDVPLATVDVAAGPTQGTCENNWCAIDAAYPTWANLTATGLTWGDIVEGDAVTC